MLKCSLNLSWPWVTFHHIYLPRYTCHHTLVASDAALETRPHAHESRTSSHMGKICAHGRVFQNVRIFSHSLQSTAIMHQWPRISYGSSGHIESCLPRYTGRADNPPAQRLKFLIGRPCFYVVL